MPSPAIAVTAASPTASPAATTQPLRILLVEDSPDNRLLITAYFNRLPYLVETAENGKVAVERFTSGHYDVVLMDIQMPVMDGYTAVRTIRAWETEHRRPATPILALTASTLDEDIPRAFAAGCNAHIAKPVRKATLLAAIEETLALVAAGIAKPAHAARRGAVARGATRGSTASRTDRRRRQGCDGANPSQPSRRRVECGAPIAYLLIWSLAPGTRAAKSAHVPGADRPHT